MSSTLTIDEFETLAEQFVEISTKLGDDWLKKTYTNGTVKGNYLVKKLFLLESDIHHVSETDNDHTLEIRDSIEDNIPTSPEFCIFEYHVIYSQSYSVPVMYFNAYHSNGKPLSLSEIWNRVPSCYQNQINATKWSALTQQDHPILNTPCFVMHPCHTAELVASVLSGSDTTSNYLVTWLSTVGPLIGLKLSPKYGVYISQINGCISE